MEWLNANDIQPQDETWVVGYSKQWIDQNSNTKGLRICYYNNGKWSSVNYSKEEGKFVITEEKPETWTVIAINNEKTKKEKIIDNLMILLELSGDGGFSPFTKKEQDDMYNFLIKLKNN